MARPERNNVDYFPFYCEEGNKMFYIEETYGNNGFATFIKLLRELAKSNYHYLDLSKPTTQMFLSAKCKVSKETLLSIISDLVELGKFDRVLWNESSVVWCQDFIDSIQDAYIKRKNKCITYDGLIQHLISLGIRKPMLKSKNNTNNTQTILKYTIQEETKEKKTKLNNTKTLLSEINISDLENEEIEYFEIAKAFNQLFIKNLKEKNAPAADQKNAKYKAYVDPIRLMMTKDGITKEQMTKVFKYLDSPQGEFWKPNILSTSKLREKFQQLILKSQANGKQINNNGGADQEFRDKTAKRLGLIKS